MIVCVEFKFPLKRSWPNVVFSAKFQWNICLDELRSRGSTSLCIKLFSIRSTIHHFWHQVVCTELAWIALRMALCSVCVCVHV